MDNSKPRTESAKSETGLPEEFFRKIRYIEIRARRAVDTLFSGEYHSAFKGRGMEYAESRPYQPGDDIRVMDWNVTARAGEPFVKMFREERELTIMLVVDVSASGRFGSGLQLKSEITAELCAALALSAIKNNDKVGLIAFSDRVELYVAPKKGRKNVLRLIRELLFLTPEGRGTDISVALDYLNKVAKKKAIAFLVSDFLTSGYERPLRVTAKKHDLIAINVADPREGNLPDVGRIALRDAETGQVVTVNTSDKTLRDEHKKAMARMAGERKKLFAASGVDQVLIRSDRSYIEPLVKFFKERERRARFG